MKYNNEPHTLILIHKDEQAFIWAKKAGPNEYVIYDKEEHILDILIRDQFFNFLDGEFTLTDSDGDSWNYSKQEANSRAKHKELFTFIDNPIAE
jgi:hypothetical protein